MAGTQYRGSQIIDVDQFLNDADGLVSEREKEIGQHIGYRYDVNLVPDYGRITPFLSKYMEVHGEVNDEGELTYDENAKQDLENDERQFYRIKRL